MGFGTRITGTCNNHNKPYITLQNRKEHFKRNCELSGGKNQVSPIRNENGSGRIKRCHSFGCMQINQRQHKIVFQRIYQDIGCYLCQIFREAVDYVLPNEVQLSIDEEYDNWKKENG